MKCLSSLSILLIFLFTDKRVSGFTVTEGRTDNGKDIYNPARTDPGAPPINLECRLDFNVREKWTTCQWRKSFPDVPVDWTRDSRVGYAFVMCTATHMTDNGRICEDQGNLNNEVYNNNPMMNPYTHYDTSRLSYSVRDNICGLTISNPHANDTGNWKCTVTDNNPEETGARAQWKEVKLFTAEKSVINITKPDMVENPSESLYLDLGSRSSADLETLECTASGSPPAKIVWYIDERTNTIDRSQYSQREQMGEDEFDVKVVSTLNTLSLDRNSLNRYGIETSNGYFSFAVGCYADQSNYFNDNTGGVNSDWNPAEIMVYGTSGAWSGAAMASVVTIILAMAAPWLL